MQKLFPKHNKYPDLCIRKSSPDPHETTLQQPQGLAPPEKMNIFKTLLNKIEHQRQKSPSPTSPPKAPLLKPDSIFDYTSVRHRPCYPKHQPLPQNTNTIQSPSNLPTISTLPRFQSPRIHPSAISNSLGHACTKSAIPHETLLYNGTSIRNHPMIVYSDKQGIHFSPDGKVDTSLFSHRFRVTYEITETLGEGGFGFVFGCIHKPTGTKVAVKFILKRSVPITSFVYDTVSKTNMPLEIHILQVASHPNIVKCLEWFQDSKYFYLVTELHGIPWKSYVSSYPPSLCPSDSSLSIYSSSSSESIRAGSISGSICRNSSRFSRDLFECISYHKRLEEKLARYIFCQIVDTVLYLQYGLNVCHRDIKDENLVVDEKYCVKLIDFGAAAYTPAQNDTKHYFKSFAGTRQYCPPEILAGYPYRGPEAEIWGLGVLLFGMLFGENPFGEYEMTQLLLSSDFSLEKILLDLQSNVYVNGIPIHQPHQRKSNVFLSTQCINLLKLLLNPYPDQRPTISQVSHHSWITGAQS